jgi:hypothetical protein
MDIRGTPQPNIPTPEISPPPNDYVAIRSLLAQLETVSLDFSVDPGKEIEPFIPPALLEWQGMCSSSFALELTGHPPLEAGPSSSSQQQHQQSLADFLSAHGYDHGSNSFIAPLDIRSFYSSIKVLLYENLEIVGSGTYSDVYRAHHKVSVHASLHQRVSDITRITLVLTISSMHALQPLKFPIIPSPSRTPLSLTAPLPLLPFPITAGRQHGNTQETTDKW